MNIYIPGTGFATQGPCDDGFHIPLSTEWSGLETIMSGLGFTTGNDWKINLHMPYAGYRVFTNSNTSSQNSDGYYWLSSPYGSDKPDRSNSVYMYSSYIGVGNSARACGFSIRPFKNEFVVPVSGWTVITGTLGSAGIFWNQTDGIISITSDGTAGYTIADKNVGATTVYSNGDTLSESNCGKYYQRGNNHGFEWTGSITTSSSQINASEYGPGNYYNSSTFITRSSSPYNWDSSNNDNLRGGTDGNVNVTTMKEVQNIYIGEYGWEPGANTIAYYPLTENANDYSGNNRDGNASNVSFTTLSGVECAYFSNSTNSKITGSFGLGVSDITISLWFNSSSGSNALSVLAMCGGTTPSHQCWLKNGTTLEADIWTGSIDTTVSDGNCRDGNWHNAISTYNRQNVTLWLDGVLIGQASQTVNIPLTSMGIGGHYGSTGGAFPYLGYIRDVIFENKIRTAQEISDYYNLTKSNYGL